MNRPSPGGRPPGPPAFTVDQLARATGTTTRHVRALQTQGLLPPPSLVGRTGYYDEDHRDRLRAVLRLQHQGFSLAAIAALFRARDAGLTLDDVLGLRHGTDVASVDGAFDEDGVDAFEGWPLERQGRLLSIVPSTFLALDEAS